MHADVLCIRKPAHALMAVTRLNSRPIERWTITNPSFLAGFLWYRPVYLRKICRTRHSLTPVQKDAFFLVTSIRAKKLGTPALVGLFSTEECLDEVGLNTVYILIRIKLSNIVMTSFKFVDSVNNVTEIIGRSKSVACSLQAEKSLNCLILVSWESALTVNKADVAWSGSQACGPTSVYVTDADMSCMAPLLLPFHLGCLKLLYNTFNANRMHTSIIWCCKRQSQNKG